jgi:hypothetical protein
MDPMLKEETLSHEGETVLDRGKDRRRRNKNLAVDIQWGDCSIREQPPTHRCVILIAPFIRHVARGILRSEQRIESSHSSV